MDRVCAIVVLLFCYRTWGNLVFNTKSFYKPAYYKVGTLIERGEDASYALPGDLGVFDGVGSWVKRGIDCGEYTRSMSSFVSDLIQKDREWGEKDINLRHILWLAESKMKTKEVNLPGSCTACLISLNAQIQILNVLNLGDSGVLLFRACLSTDEWKDETENIEGPEFELIFRSSSMYHSFNLPYQIGNDPETATLKQRNVFDKATDSVVSHIPVVEGDIVIVASDGMLDNVDIPEIKEILRRCSSKSGDKIKEDTAYVETVTADIFTADTITAGNYSADSISNDFSRLAESILDKLSETAVHNSMDPHKITPWSQSVVQERDLQALQPDKKNNPAITALNDLSVSMANLIRPLFSDSDSNEEVGSSTLPSNDPDNVMGVADALLTQVSNVSEAYAITENSISGGKPDDITIHVSIINKKHS